MLAPEMFKHWVNVLCVAAQHDGELPPISVTAFMLGRIPEQKAASILAKLCGLGLLDKTEKGFKPHNWDGRQYKHDKLDATNADRQARFRSKKNNGSNADSNAKSNASETVTAKRPEYREQNITEANASGADAPIDPAIAEREYFARGKVVFGKSSGGLLANLLKSKGGNVALARAAVEMASTKENPAQYVGAMIRNPTAKPLTEHQRQQHETRGILDAMDDFTGRCDESRSQNLELLPDYSGERSQDVRGRLGQGSLGIPGGRH